MQITLSGVSYTYPSATEPILNNISATFPQGWSGLLGDNGCGKTTLAKIICGMIEPDAGTITRGLFALMCAQETATPPDGLSDFALDYGREARELRRIFHIEDDMAWRYDELSCGEQKKLQVATTLWQRPDVLVLDEPTNHIDHEAREQLTCALRRFNGIGILVSHDRELLDALAERCVSFETGSLTVRPGGYTAAHGQMELERTTMVRERKAAKDNLARLAAEKDARAHEAARAKARMSKRHLDPKDRSAKAMIDLAKFTGQDGVRGKLSTQMDSRLAAAQERVANARVEKRYDGDLWLEAHPSQRKTLARIEPAKDARAHRARDDSVRRSYTFDPPPVHRQHRPHWHQRTQRRRQNNAPRAYSFPSGSEHPDPRHTTGAERDAAGGCAQTHHRALRCRARSSSVYGGEAEFPARPHPGGWAHQPRGDAQTHVGTRHARPSPAHHHGRADQPPGPPLN